MKQSLPPVETGTAPRRPSARLALLDAVAAADVPFVRYEIAGRDVVFVNEPELVQQILVTSASSFEKSEFQNRVMGVAEGSGTGLGNGLLTSSNADHRRQHEIIAPLFSARALRRYLALMASESRETRARWRAGQRLDAAAEMMRLSTRIIARTMFSWELGDEEERVAADLELVGRLLGRPARERQAGWDDPHVVEKASEYMERRLLELVAGRRGAVRGDDEVDLIDVLLRAQAHDAAVTDRQIRDEVMTMFITGAENPRNALTWTLYLLGRHPEVARAVEREIASASAGEGEVTAELLARLPLTLQVFKEVLRLYPPGYAFGRRATDELHLGPLHLQPDSEVVISPYALHRRPSHFERPTEFDPSRFAGDSERRLRPYTYLPFGAGARGCIGARFSLLEGHVALAALLGGVELGELASVEVLPEPRMTLRPGGPVPLVVRGYRS